MDFNIIAPMAVTDTELTASNIPEDDHPVWAAGVWSLPGSERASILVQDGPT